MREAAGENQTRAWARIMMNGEEPMKKGVSMILPIARTGDLLSSAVTGISRTKTATATTTETNNRDGSNITTITEAITNKQMTAGTSITKCHSTTILGTPQSGFTENNAEETGNKTESPWQ